MKKVESATIPLVAGLAAISAIDLEHINAAEQRLDAEATDVLGYQALWRKLVSGHSLHSRT
jgi:hypothetical protein